jgi:hypothetical protein
MLWQSIDHVEQRRRRAILLNVTVAELGDTRPGVRGASEGLLPSPTAESEKDHRSEDDPEDHSRTAGSPRTARTAPERQENGAKDAT